jgi:hypothetical protein
MSNLDVQVLKSFTNKLAAAAKLAGRRPFIDDDPTPSNKPIVPNVTRPAKAFPAPAAPMAAEHASDVDLSPDIRLPADNEPPTTINVRDRKKVLAPPERMDSLSPSPQELMGLTPRPDPLPPANSDWYSMLTGALPYAGGAAAGGLGAMALARLFNSSKDDEEEGSWAPWLAGLGGAAAGAGAVHYSDQLAEMARALAGSAGLGGDTAPAAVSAPAAQA